MAVSSAKNKGAAFSAGFNLGIGNLTRAGANLGGTGMGVIGGAIAGASLGANASMFSGGQIDPGTGAAAGAVVGAAALPAAGMAAGVIGNVGWGAIKAAPTVAAGIGKGAAAASPFVAGVGTLAATRVGEAAWNVGSRMVNWDIDADTINKVKFTGPLSGIKAGWKSGGNFTKLSSVSGGAAKTKAALGNVKTGVEKFGRAAEGSIINGGVLIGATMAFDAGRKAYNTLMNAKMGQMTGVETMTPRTPSYANNAGATGDLVFALNRNRRG